MEHREIRLLLENEVMDEQKKTDLLAIEQELNEYFKSQPSEDFRQQLKQFLLKEVGVTRGAKVLGLKYALFRFWPVATIAAVAVIMMVSFGNPQVWKKYWPGFQATNSGTMVVSLKDESILPESQEANKIKPMEDNSNLGGDTDSKDNANTQNTAVETGSKRTSDQLNNQLNNQPQSATDLNNNIGDLEAAGDTADILFGSLSLSSSATRAGIHRDKQMKILSYGINYEQDKVWVYREKTGFIDTAEAWSLAQCFGLLKEGLLYENDLEYRFVQDDQTLTLAYKKLPISIHYQKKGANDLTPSLLNKDQAVQKAREALTALPCFEIVSDIVSPVTLVEDDYLVTFWQHVGGLRLLSDGVRVRVDRESGAIIEINGSIHRFETVAEYPLLTVDQAVTGIFESAKGVDIQQVELIQSLKFNGPNNIMAVPGYYITGCYPDGRPYETTVPAIEQQ